MQRSRRLYIDTWSLFNPLFLIITGCTSISNSTLTQTQIALSVQQTIIAKDISQLTQQVQNNPPVYPTQAVALQVTYTPVSTALTEVPTATPHQDPLPTVMLPPSPVTAEIDEIRFDDWVRESQILVYEDIAGDTRFTRWIATSLKNLELDFFDTGDRIGEFRDQLTANKDWDLVIYARENRTNTSGNVFDALVGEHNAGSSLIIEHWDLDDILNFSTDLSYLFNQCGIDVQKDWFDQPDSYQILFAHHSDNPIHNQPNKGIRLSSFNDIRWTGDQGDLMQVKQDSYAQLLFGARSAYDTSHGTVLSCFNDRFILQTHSTHQYEKLRMIQLWENYIYNTLYARYQYLLEK